MDKYVIDTLYYWLQRWQYYNAADSAQFERERQERYECERRIIFICGQFTRSKLEYLWPENLLLVDKEMFIRYGKEDATNGA
jgi:hypothetical protein